MVFIATDAAPDDPLSPRKLQKFFAEEKSPIKLFTLSEIYSFGNTKHKFTELDVSLLEQTMLVFSTVFVGTGQSMYTISIKEMREAIHPNMKSHEL